jgi:hypothetical protein
MSTPALKHYEKLCEELREAQQNFTTLVESMGAKYVIDEQTPWGRVEQDEHLNAA